MDMEKLRNLSSQAEARLSSKGQGDAPPVETPVVTPAPETTPPPAEVTPPPAEVIEEKEPKETPSPASEEKPSPGSPALSEPKKDEKVAPPAAASPTYKPNYKYTVSKEEKEIPEFFKGLIKDEASEKMVRDYIERAEGLAPVKARLQDTFTELKETKQKYHTIQEGLADIGEIVRKEDYGTFFETLKIPREKIYAWVLKQAEYEQLPPERKREIDAAQAAQLRLDETAQENQSWQSQLAEQANRTRTLELSIALGAPEISSFATAFDERAGKAGSFKMEVQKLGKHVWDTENVDLPADEAAKRVMQHYSRFITVGTTPSAISPAGAASVEKIVTPTATTPAPLVKREVPVIPNIAGGTTSPTKSAPKSMEDLNKLAKEASARIAARTP